MNHEQFQELVNLYIDGELDDKQSADMFLHLSICDDCRNYMSSSLRIRSYYQQEELEEVPVSLDTRVCESAGIRPITTTRRNPLSPLWYTRILIPLPAAASIAFLILVGSLLFSPLLFEEPKQHSENQIEMLSKMPPEFQQKMQFFQ